MKTAQVKTYTVAEYQEQERITGQKHEYHDGQIFALAGGSVNHALLSSRILIEIGNQLKTKNSNCQAYNSDLKLNVKNKLSNRYMYPDAMVVYGKLELSEDDKNSITNPTVIVEVLSDSTKAYDRGDKFHFYQKISSLQEYIIVEQDKPVVDIYYKAPNSDLWRISRVEGLDSTIHLQSVEANVMMKDLYLDVKFDS